MARIIGCRPALRVKPRHGRRKANQRSRDAKARTRMSSAAITRTMNSTAILAAALTAASFAIAFAAAPPSANSDAALIARANQAFAQFQKPGSPGCAAGIIRNGRLIHARGYGYANLDYRLPITAKTVFDIGSTSKQFAAMAVLLLEKDGKLSIDDDIRKLIPEIPAYDRPITIRHLLTHTSGMRDYLTLFRLALYGDDDFYTDDDVLAMLARQKELNFAPGDEFLYSNSGFFLLSVIVKRASGKSLREFSHERIFLPLGMTNTHFHDRHAEIVPNRATGYSPLEGSPGKFRIDMSTLDMVGDGGVYTSIEDLAKWDANFYTGAVGGKELLARMQERMKLTNGKEIDYGLGLMLRGDTVSHGGSWAGFRAELIRQPSKRTSVVALCNLSTAKPTQLAIQVLDLGGGAPGGTNGRAVRQRTPPSTGLEGEYYSDELDVVYRIVSTKDGLAVKARGGKLEPLVHEQADNFHLGPSTLAFEIRNGKAAGFSIFAGRVKNIRFIRRDVDAR